MRASLQAAREALAAVDCGSSYGNFAEQRVDPGALHDEATLARLREIKAAVDPGDVMHGNHPLAVAV